MRRVRFIEKEQKVKKVARESENREKEQSYMSSDRIYTCI